MTRCRTAFFVLSLPFSVHAAVAQAPHERLIALAADGSVLATIDGGATSAAIGTALDQVLRRADAHVRLTHNHPASTGLSAADLEQLTKPGVDAIEAIGSDGSRYEARRGPRYDPVFFESHQYEPVDLEVGRRLAAAAKSAADRSCFDAHRAHITAIALHKAGVIVYHAALSPDRSASYERYRPAFGPAAEISAARVRASLR